MCCVCVHVQVLNVLLGSDILGLLSKLKPQTKFYVKSWKSLTVTVFCLLLVKKRHGLCPAMEED